MACPAGIEVELDKLTGLELDICREVADEGATTFIGLKGHCPGAGNQLRSSSIRIDVD
jgi:hypothetical protein